LQILRENFEKNLSGKMAAGMAVYVPKAAETPPKPELKPLLEP
jgi:hypothetical protein